MHFRKGEGRLGRYRLIARLGQGCQGEVWKALQTDPIVEAVALKLLAPALAAEPQRRAQFHREAELGARLSSPWLLPTYEFGEINGIAFMSMPLVNGDSLAEVILQRKGARPSHEGSWWAWLPEAAYVRAMIRVLARVARALHVAHQSQVAHRDIKPANILVDRDREDRSFLCDFGLSRELGSTASALARDGTGTPLYMAPEKLMGLPADEIRCDIYALGVTLFEAVTQVHPFSVPTDLPRSDWSSYLAVSTPLKPLVVNPKLPRPLEMIILKAMHRDPTLRYPSATSLASDLERLASVLPPS